MASKLTRPSEKAETDAAFSKSDSVAILADHRSALLSEFKTSFKELNEPPQQTDVFEGKC